MDEVRISLMFWDAIYAEWAKKRRKSTFVGASVVCLFYDVNDPHSITNFDDWFSLIQQEEPESLQLFYVIGNKIDLENKIHPDVINNKISQWRKESRYEFHHIYSSSKLNIEEQNPNYISDEIMRQLGITFFKNNAIGDKLVFKVVLIGEDGVGKSKFTEIAAGFSFDYERYKYLGPDFLSRHQVFKISELQ